MRARNKVALGGLGLLALLAAWAGTAGAESKERYPYDPACPWGRIADGHGMMIRCLLPQEASALLSGTPVQGASSAAQAAPARAAKAPAETKRPRGRVEVGEVGPVKADTGELPLAARKLSVPKDRYVACVDKHGGLEAQTAKVVVRFLVRERGRAEGVAVKSRTGMSAAAAECIADVVDRRYVGYPAAPIVGAELPIELNQKR